jgi:hypothetical protein
MWHELGTVPLKQNLPVPGTSSHLVEIPKKLVEDLHDMARVD